MKQVCVLTSLLFILMISFAIAALPSPWQNQDIGNVGTSGSCTYSNGIYSVDGSGADIWNTADEFHYVYQPHSGNVQIITQVTSQTNTDDWAKAGLMIRETLDSNSKHAMMIITPSNGSSFQYRTTTGYISYHTTPYNSLTTPCWLKLIRLGEEFKGYSSADGETWTLISSTTISMSAEVYIGLCVTAHNDGQLSTGIFENVSIQTDTTPPTPDPATWAEVPHATSANTVQMTATAGTDLSGPVEYYFEETTGHEGGSNSGWITNTTYIDYSLKPLQTYTYMVCMRDAMGNIGADSSPVSVTTGPIPDADGNDSVTLSDFASFIINWDDTDCQNTLWCNGSDFDLSGTVNISDLWIFCNAWLQPMSLGHFYDWAQTPPMGWNSYDCYGYAVRENQVKENADFLDQYLKSYGWQYVVVDFCWYVPDVGLTGVPNQNSLFEPHSNFDEYGRLLPDPDRFPSSAGGAGFKPLADYIHNLGLKFGIHLMRGIPREVVAADLPVKGTPYTASEIAVTSSTCSWYNLMYGLNMSHPGAQAYLDSLFELYVSWDVDFVKVDDLSRPYHTSEVEGYRNAIDDCNRVIILSTSPGATPISEAEHVKNHANMWRLTDDLWDTWDSVDQMFDKAYQWYNYSGPGHWPDLDMLPLGRLAKYGPVGSERYSNLTQDESYLLITLWCITRSPLMFGGNLPENDIFTTNLITNPEVLEVNQNSTNNRPIQNNSYPIWVADIPDSNDVYLAVFNRTSTGPTSVEVTLTNLGIKRCDVRNLWTQTDLGEYTDVFSPDVNSHGAKLYKLTVLEAVPIKEPVLEISLSNPGFDDQMISDGSWSAAGDILGWSDDSGGYSHAQNLSSEAITPEAQSFENTCGLNQGSWIGQNLTYTDNSSVLIEEEKTYEITVWVGRRAGDEGAYGGILEVCLKDSVSDTQIAQDSYDLDTQAQNAWTYQTFTLATGASPSGLGHPLCLGFKNIGTRAAEHWHAQVVLDSITISESENTE